MFNWLWSWWTWSSLPMRPTPVSRPIIEYGEYTGKQTIINSKYNDIYAKVTEFLTSGGIDLYGRAYRADGLITFAIEHEITDKSADYIYRQYVYDSFKSAQPDLDVNKLEIDDMFAEFLKIDATNVTADAL